MRCHSAALIALFVLVARGCAAALSTVSTTASKQQHPLRLWQALEKETQQAWTTIFGQEGECGEYMDGYSEQAMIDRCMQDYMWGSKFAPDAIPSERARPPSVMPI